MRHIKFFSILIIASVSTSLIAQEQSSDTQHAEGHESFIHHRLAVFTGYAFIGGAIDEDEEE